MQAYLKRMMKINILSWFVGLLAGFLQDLGTIQLWQVKKNIFFLYFTVNIYTAI